MEQFCVGIDVSAKKLDVTWRGSKGREEGQTFENESAGHRELVQELKKREQQSTHARRQESYV